MYLSLLKGKRMDPECAFWDCCLLAFGRRVSTYVIPVVAQAVQAARPTGARQPTLRCAQSLVARGDLLSGRYMPSIACDMELGLDKWFHTTRLETRTKESNTCASLHVPSM